MLWLQRKEELRQELDLSRYETDSEPGAHQDEAAAADADQQIFVAPDWTATVTTMPVKMNSSRYALHNLIFKIRSGLTGAVDKMTGMIIASCILGHRSHCFHCHFHLDLEADTRQSWTNDHRLQLSSISWHSHGVYALPCRVLPRDLPHSYPGTTLELPSVKPNCHCGLHPCTVMYGPSFLRHNSSIRNQVSSRASICPPTSRLQGCCLSTLHAT